MEGSVKILLNHLQNREQNVNSIMLQLAYSLLRIKHDGSNCTSYRSKLETLGVVMKYASEQTNITANNAHVPVIEEILNMCCETLCSLVDGKDLCITIVCDVLCSSLALLPQNIMNTKIKLIIHKCRSQLTELVESSSVMCEDLHNSSIEVTKLGINLRIWESVIGFMISWRNKPEHIVGNKPFIDMALFDDEFVGLLLKIINCEHDVLTSQTLLCLIPKLVCLTKSNSLVEKLWESIVDKFSSANSIHKVTSHMFVIMCALSDYFIPCEYDVPYSYPVGHNCDFWRILQYGLVSHDALMRKQALYLLKRAFEQEYTVPTPICHEPKTVLFWWNQKNSEQFHKVWNELFLLLEVLEEKQLHLIEPVQPIVMSLIRACQKSLIHSSWILCVIQRALRHESNAVVKWGILCFTELDIILYVVTNMVYSDILYSLLNALNSSSMYVMSSKNLSVPDVVERLRSFFIAVVESEANVHQEFFRNLLNCIVQVSWGPVALFYVVFALAAIPKCPVWRANDIQLLKSFMTDALTTQVVHIRGGIQSLFIDLLINLADEQHLDVSTVAEIMGSFNRSECLRRGSLSWQKVTSWLKSFISEEQAFRYTQKSCEAIFNGDLECEKQTAARMIVLLSDADLICLDVTNSGYIYSLRTTLLSLVDYFENCHERMYVCHVKQDSCLEMLIHLLQESHPIIENDKTGKCILSLIFMVLPGIFYCIKRYVLSAYNLQNFDTVSMYLHSLTVLAKEPRLCSDLLKYADVMQDVSFSIINSESANTTPMSKYFSVKVISWISDLINTYYKDDSHIKRSVLCERQMLFLRNILRMNLNQILPKAKQDKILTCDMQTLWGRLVSGYMQCIWSLVNVYFEIQSNLSLLNVDSELACHILKEAGEALDLGGRGMLIPVMSVTKQIVHLFIMYNLKEEVKKFMSMCWTGIFELRKSDLFWVSMEKFIKMAFQKCIMDDAEMNETLLIFARKIFIQGETVTGLCNVLLQQLQDVAKHYSLSHFQSFAEILVDALVFGPVYRRDRKIDDETSAFIRTLGNKCCINEVSEIYSDAEVRARAIELLLSCQEHEMSNNMKVRVKVAHLLLQRDIQISRKNGRCYADSHYHRYRNRIMQVLLVLEPLLPKDECGKLATYLHNSLLTENHQPSIRYLQEWLLIRLIYKNHEALSQIWTVFQAASETRPGSLCSFISIVYHLAHIIQIDEGLENLIDKAMKEILSCTMAQHFNVRLYAQVSLFKLWEFAHEKGLANVTEKYRIVYMGILTGLQTPSTLKSVKKLEDFYFTTFHPLDHYSLQTIFYELPRLTNVTQEEWISATVLLSCGVKTTFPLFNRSTDLQDCEHLSSIVKSSLVDDALHTQVTNVQKKIIPWRAMVPDPEMLLSVSESVLRRKQMILEDGLIVVASLIDRPPNLGGLSRTCETFGVSQYVIGNLKYLEEKQFQTLSVSAERWISIIEVKPHELPSYLEEMKCKGYTIVGAEQTANSVLLNKVKFPKRTVLLLGNEKEGTPVNLLPLLDICVEVPQQGVIRSLNVHVTGAIFIWEYARQHNVKH